MSPSEEVFAWLRGQCAQEIETSCARVFLLGDRALKVKKPVDYGFLDFSTLEKRKWALDRELAFNTVAAPDIYRAVRRVTRGPGGELALDGIGKLVDVALEMRRFDPACVLSECPDKVDGDLAEALGRTIARFHAAAPVNPEGGGVKALGYTIRTNAEHLRSLKGPLDPAEVERVATQTDAAFAAASPLLERRRAEGFARRCHGDLHLANILLENGVPRLFDCIEFNDLLSEIDVLYDIAFTVMDLCFRGRIPAANRLLNAYLDEAARDFPPQLWDGLAALPVMLSARASVRAHVTANQEQLEEAGAYLAEAGRRLAQPPPVLVAVGGLSGSGKTTFARALAPRLGAAPGAVILRSDEIRKRLWGVAPHERLPPTAYAPGTSQPVYAEMLAIARRTLAAGRTTILDAVHLKPEERQETRALAAELGVPFHGVWLQAPPPVLQGRLDARTGDASDATSETLRGQLGREIGPMDWTAADATDLDGAVERVVLRSA